MKKLISIGLLFNATILFSQEMVKYQVNEEISYQVPESFVVMSEGDRLQKFVSAREPLAMHSSQDREVNFGVNWNPMQWIDGDEEIIYGFYKASIQSMFDQVEFLQDEVKEVNGRKFIVFEFIGSLTSENAFSGTKSSRTYSYIQYTAYNGQVLLFNFGCKARLMGQWQSAAREIMNSVKVKKK
ncbi:hypothetical protein SAMN05421640_1977 [Ekhidna lutea]|uniref:Uncharacterized protein n=1 Tax=Ekhidna lutea TaxID=447679 RepID=A0A239J3Y5_EKHLU|nr:hypothetical protein [Ekhidna lutea]SNT00557.1 hypothetical protein SAMN05421640_1977 [Ekhidna lutea]